MDPRANLHVAGEEKNMLPLPGIKMGFLSCQFHSLIIFTFSDKRDIHASNVIITISISDS